MYVILGDPAFANTAVTGKQNMWLLLFNHFQAIRIQNFHDKIKQC